MTIYKFQVNSLICLLISECDTSSDSTQCSEGQICRNNVCETGRFNDQMYNAHDLLILMCSNICIFDVFDALIVVMCVLLYLRMQYYTAQAEQIVLVSLEQTALQIIVNLEHVQ